MTDTVERFTTRVENYVRYRPGYPREVLSLFEREMSLRKESVVADIGSGTGISSRLFLEYGCRVLGVEPNAAMRRAAEGFLRGFPNFESVDGTAENTGLPDSSVDFVIAAQAFHWFDPAGTRREFGRILREGGYAALIWNERRVDGTDFLRDYENFLLRFGTDYRKVRHDNIDEETLADFFQRRFERRSFQNSQSLDFEGLQGRVLSSSYMPAQESGLFGEMNAELRRLFDKYAENGKIQILYNTNVFFTRF